MFADYKARGESFRAAVKRLSAGNASGRGERVTVVELAKTRIWQRARATGKKAGAGTGTRTYYLMTSITAILLGFGLVMILSASSVSSYTHYGSSFMFFQRQVMWAVIGVAAMFVASRIDYHRWRGLGWIVLLATIGGLVLVLHPSFGTRVGGSSRWLGFGSVRVQPSEIAKLALLLVAADVVVRKNGRMTTLREVILPLGVLVAIVAGLIMLQPDLGTTLIVAAIVFVVIFVGGLPLPLIAGLGVVGVVGRRRDGARGGLPPRAHLRVPESVRRPAEFRIPGGSVADRARFRRVLRRRARRLAGRNGSTSPTRTPTSSSPSSGKSSASSGR